MKCLIIFLVSICFINLVQVRIKSDLTSLKQSLTTKENYIVSGEILKSLNGQYILTLDQTGDLIILNNSKEIWRRSPSHSGLGPFKLILLEDGNTEIHDSKEKIVWETNTKGKGTSPYRLRMQDNGILALLDANNVSTWTSELKSNIAKPIARTSSTIHWTGCSREGGTCSFKGARIVKYGANGKFSYRMATNSIGCNNRKFGDPIVGTGKACEYYNSDLIWNECSQENGHCNFEGTRVIRYGAIGRYHYNIGTNTKDCNNRVFGDPMIGIVNMIGIVKKCYYSEALNSNVNNWKRCSNENSHCSFTGSAIVKYGANGAFFYRRVSNGINCNNSEFGDPLKGIFKFCEISQ